MYKLKTLTNKDGSTYETHIWESKPQEWSWEQEQTSRAIETFGTSS